MGPQRLGEHLFDLLVIDASRSSAARRVGQRPDLLPGITAAPLADRRQRDSFAPAISVLVNPCEAPSMILARCASRWLDFGRLAIKVSFLFRVALFTEGLSG